MTNAVVEQIRNNASNCPDLAGELAKAIAEIERLELKMVNASWHDAAIELPDDGLIVLVFAPEANFSEPVWFGYLDSESGVWRYVDGVSIDSHTVTHWMPLPAGPAGGAVCPHQSKKNQY